MKSVGQLTTLLVVIGMISGGLLVIDFNGSVRFFRNVAVFMLGGGTDNPQQPSTLYLDCNPVTGECMQPAPSQPMEVNP